MIISRIAFVFLIYAFITSGYLAEILSCQMRHFLKTTKYGRHVFGVLMVFVFIMFEGGWSFDKVDEDTNWSSGNAFHSLVMALGIYIVFLISSKSRIVPNFLFFGIIFVLYVTNTQRMYWFDRDLIDEKTNSKILSAEKAMLLVAAIVLVYGFVDYVVYQRGFYGARFNWSTFVFGTPHCNSILVDPKK